MDDKFSPVIASDTERGKVFCEIFYEDQTVAEISEPILTIFSHPEKWWEFPLGKDMFCKRFLLPGSAGHQEIIYQNTETFG